MVLMGFIEIRGFCRLIIVIQAIPVNAHKLHYWRLLSTILSRGQPGIINLQHSNSIAYSINNFHSHELPNRLFFYRLRRKLKYHFADYGTVFWLANISPMPGDRF